MIKKTLKRHAFLIAIITVIVITFWIIIFTFINSPKDKDICYVFVSGNINNEWLEDEIKNSSKFLNVVIFECYENDKNYYTALQTSGLVMSDILIITDELLAEPGFNESFIYLDEIDNTFTYYQIDDHNYGLMINDLFKYYLTLNDSTRPYYLVIKDNEKKDESLMILKALIDKLKTPN